MSPVVPVTWHRNPGTDLHALVAVRDWRRLGKQLTAIRAPDVAAMLTDVPEDDWVFVYKVLSGQKGAAVFAHLAQHQRERLYTELTPPERAELLGRLPVDDLAYFLARLEPVARTEAMQLLNKRGRAHVRRLLRYAPGSAGRLMTSEVIRLRHDRTVGEALGLIRDTAGRAETVDIAAVSAPDGAFAGLVTLDTLALAPLEATVGELAARPPASIAADASREEAARLVEHYDVAVLPVMDDAGRFLGLITSDDVLDVLEEFETRSFHHAGGIRPSLTPIRSAGVTSLVRSRVGVLLGCGLLGLVGIALLDGAARHLQAFTHGLFLLPVILGVAGNVAMQSAALSLRAIDTGVVRPGLKHPLRELFLTSALGTTLALIIMPFAFWLGNGSIAIFAGIVMILVTTLAGMTGAMAPLLMRRAGRDPGHISMPIISTFADLLGIAVFLLALVVTIWIAG